jgi:hypothetical protein
MSGEFDFLLPVGYLDDDGTLHRTGTMRLATALDEIEIHSDERMLSSERYHDILLFSRVITKIGDYSPVTAEIVEGLFEVDFRYLQSLYMEKNGQLQHRIESVCPKCQSRNTVDLAKVYSNLEFYFSKDAAAGA